MPLFRLLAISPDTVIATLFALISIGAAIVNALSGKKEPPRKNPGGRPKDQRVRQEIEEFLDQQSGGRKPPPIELGPNDIELVEEPPRRRPPSPVVKPTRNPKSAPKPAVPASRVAAPPKPPAPRASAKPTQVTKRHESPVGSTDMGGGLREHVKNAMAERVAVQAQRDLPHLASTMGQKVREDLGAPDTKTFSVSGKTDAVRSGASPLVLMLQNPKTARQAVLMSEIMARPKALRK